MRKLAVLSGTTIVLFCLSAPISGAQSQEQGPDIRLQLQGPQNYAGFILQSENLEGPLEITAAPGRDIGAVFVRTADGRHWLAGEPEQAERTAEKYQAVWTTQEGRQISVSVQKQGDDFFVKLCADPADDVLGWGFNIAAEADEYFTGLFERTVDGGQSRSWREGIAEAMDLRGQHVDMLIKPTLSAYAPFYISSRGYGVFTYGTWPGEYDFCRDIDELVQIEFEGPQLACRIYARGRPAELVKAHALEAGPPIVPPKWVFSSWRWRDNHTNKDTYYDGTPVDAPFNSQVVEDILMMHALDIPCGVYWVDRPWAIGPRGYSDFEWDTERLPDPEQMVQWLDSRGTRFMLWVAPWIMGDIADYAVEHGYNLKGQTDHTYGRVLIDFTNPDARRWWQQVGPAKLLKQGVAGFKLDRAEEIVPQSRDITCADGRTTRELRNDYPVEYAKALYETAREIRGDDFFLMPRAAYTGTSRYAGLWGGDIRTPPEGLRCAIIALQKCAVMGYPVWGSDTGGYWGDPLDREVCARWLAFSCFCPIMEVGPTHDRAFWDMPGEPGYDAELIATWRLYAKLHTHLMDYTHRCAVEASETGLPIARPLMLIRPEQAETWRNWQTYMYGPDILVHAIWRKYKRTCKVYLPEGERWRDAWDPEKVYQGGETVTIDIPFYKIPVFLREGSRLQLGDLDALYEESLKIAAEPPDLKELEKLLPEVAGQ